MLNPITKLVFDNIFFLIKWQVTHVPKESWTNSWELKIQACCVNLSITWYLLNDIPIEHFTLKYATTNYSDTALLKKVSTTKMEEILGALIKALQIHKSFKNCDKPHIEKISHPKDRVSFIRRVQQLPKVEHPGAHLRT